MSNKIRISPYEIMVTGMYVGIKNSKEMYKKTTTQSTRFTFKVSFHSLGWGLWLKRAQKAMFIQIPRTVFAWCHYSNVHKEYNLRACFSPIITIPTSSPRWTDLVHLDQELANFSVKSHLVNILGFAGYTVSVATTQLGLQSTNAATDYTN